MLGSLVRVETRMAPSLASPALIFFLKIWLVSKISFFQHIFLKI